MNIRDTKKLAAAIAGVVALATGSAAHAAFQYTLNSVDADGLPDFVLTQARRFETLKVDHEGKDIPELAPLEVGVRQLSKLAGPDAPKPPAQLELVPPEPPSKRK